jgi:alpha-galactosidase
LKTKSFPLRKGACMKTLLLLSMLSVAAHAATHETQLSTLDLAGMKQGYGEATVDASVLGAPLLVGGRSYEAGIGTHAPAVWTLPLAGKATEFRAKVGVQQYSDNPGVGSVEFLVRGDGRELWRSGVLRGSDAAKEVRVKLAGVQTLTLEVTDGGDGNRSDHADWLEPVIVHDGAPLPVKPEEALLPDEPGAPPNAAAKIEWLDGALQLGYDGKVLFQGRVTGKAEVANVTTRKKQAVTQTLTLTGRKLKLKGIVTASDEAIAAETKGPSQQTFPLVRTVNGGPSRNLRNNAIYDRGRDWLLAGATCIEPHLATRFTITATGDKIALTFRPRFYQRHKNIAYFQPWTYRVRQDSITGWCSWFVRFRDITQKDCDDLLAVWKDKKFADYGYRFVQLDDGFQSDLGPGERRPQWPGANASYPSSGPVTWLDLRKDHFPLGMKGFSAACRDAGFSPAIWIGSHFTGKELIEKHPDWFVRDAQGKPFVGPWISCGLDATNPAALNALVRPTFAGVRKAGISYVKIDLLRHYLYDNLNHNQAYCKGRGVTPADMFRKFLGTAREEVGRNTFILSCWGVLPEAVGLADGCRIAGDGYGPVSMQQYNSWNGIVWRNDPDACDVYPQFKPAETGNVTKFAKVTAAPADTIIRPALASIAGCMLMLSDRPAVYRDDANLTGLRRAAPVLFSVPGQLYDFDESKSHNLVTTERAAITSGTNPSPIDANQFGPVCPWWLNEFDRPFEHWNVLHRLNWSGQAGGKTVVKFADLGLDAGKTYLVYEFWSGRFFGAHTGGFEAPAIKPMGLDSFALREQLDHPQIISTSRHLSQGGVDLANVEWKHDALTGKSRVVAGDRYELVLYAPPQFKIKSAAFGNQPAEVTAEGKLFRLAFMPASTAEIGWRIVF